MQQLKQIRTLVTKGLQTQTTLATGNRQHPLSHIVIFSTLGITKSIDNYRADTIMSADKKSGF